MSRRILLALLAGATGCIRVAGSVAQPTALERQLLGEYARLDDELVWASSVRGGAGDGRSYEVLRANALEARSMQRFNEDGLLELKNQKCLAEKLDAHVVARTCSLLEKDESAKRRLERVVREE